MAVNIGVSFLCPDVAWSSPARREQEHSCKRHTNEYFFQIFPPTILYIPYSIYPNGERSAELRGNNPICFLRKINEGKSHSGIIHLIMENTLTSLQLWRKHIALPQDHGSWVFLLSPLIVGLFASGKWTPGMPVLVLAAMTAFLVRQPLTVIVKVYSGRKNHRDLPAAFFWTAVYGVIGLVSVAVLVLMGYGYLLYLALPGAPVFIWYLWLVSRRAERRQLGVELVATGVLSLAATAGYWMGQGYADPRGWLLWGLLWFQSAASIVHAYMRLEQRELKPGTPVIERLKAAGSFTQRAWLYTSFNLAVVILLTILKVLPAWLFFPYLLQWAETVYTTFRPAIGVKPTIIGIRQLIVSSLFTVLFIVAWILT